jgi:hypothetical protein
MLDTGIRDVRNQGVLLRGVNDTPDALTRRYEYHDPIYTLPEEGRNWWRERSGAA